MFLYNLRLAFRSLRRNPVLTAVLITAIALGICVSTTFVALRHLFGKNPLPGVSHTLFYVRLDAWDPKQPYPSPGNDPNAIPTQLTHKDMRALMRSGISTRQTGLYQTTFFVFPDPKIGKPYSSAVRMTFADFFTMFRAPFQYGGPWDKAAEDKPEQVVVIDQATNNRVFRGENSVGRVIRIGDRDFKVAGVLAAWRPNVRVYDMTGGLNNAPEPIYMPFNFTLPMRIGTTGNSDGWSSEPINSFEDFLNSEQVWLQYWVELPTAAKEAEYRDFLRNYINDQKKLGRFQRPLHFELTDVAETMDVFGAVPPAVKSMSVVSLLFLIVCSMNLIGLLLGKFLARVPEVSVRRALGASRWQVFVQHIVECEVVGIAGGAAGLLLSVGILRLIGKFVPNGDFIALDGEMVLVSVLLSLVAGLIAGLYPSWRACSVVPAMQLKLQ